MKATPTAGLRVLIADDFEDYAESTAFLLQMHGYTVDIATNGEDALEAAAQFRPDVVLLDLDLPKVNGFEVARQLTSSRPCKTPLVVAVSGYGPDTSIGQAASGGIDLHMVKPVHPDHLLNVLEKFRYTLDGIIGGI